MRIVLERAAWVLIVIAGGVSFADDNTQTEQLLAILRSGDSDARCEALCDLDPAAVDVSAVTPAIREQLADAEAVVRISAAAAWLRLDGPPQGVESLLDDEDDDVRLTIARLLLHDGRRIDAAIDAVVRADEDGSDVFAALSRERARATAAPLLQRLDDAETAEEAFFAYQSLSSNDGLTATNVRALAELLADRSDNIRRYAAMLLSELEVDRSAAVPALVTALADPEVRIRPIAAAVLLQLKTHEEAALNVLREALRSGPGHGEAVEALRGLPQFADRFMPELIDMLGREDRYDAVELLGSTGPDVLPHLRAELDVYENVRPFTYLRAGIADTIGSLGPDGAGGIPLLLSLSEFPDEEVQVAAVGALAQVGAGLPKVIERITAMLDSPLPEVRLKAVGVLWTAAGATDGEPALRARETLRALLHDPNNSVRLTAVNSLIDAGEEVSVVLPPLDELLQGADGEAAFGALQAYSRLGPKAAPSMKVLVAALSSNASLPAGFHAYPIGEVAPQWIDAVGPALVPGLIESLRSADPQVRARAAETLRIIGPPAADAAPELARLLEDGTLQYERGGPVSFERLVVEDVIGAVGAIGVASEGVVPRLIEIMNEPPGDVWPDNRQALAVWALGKLGKAAEMALADLRSHGSDPAFPGRSAVVCAIARITPEDPQTIIRLQLEFDRVVRVAPLEDLFWDEPFELIQTVTELGEFGRPLWPELARLMSDAPLLDYQIRCEAAAALARVDRADSRPWQYLRRQAVIESRGVIGWRWAQSALDGLESAGMRAP